MSKFCDNVDCVASSRTYTRLMGRKPPDPPDTTEDEDDLEDLGDLDDVPDDILEQVEEKTDHDRRTNDDKPKDPKGKHNNNLVMDDVYLANLKTVWPVPEPTRDEYDVPTAIVPDNDNHDDDDEEDDAYCKLCHMMEQPMDTYLSHNYLAPVCPSLMSKDRMILYGHP